MAEPEIRASDLAYVSRWGRALSLFIQLLRRPDPVKMLEERHKREKELKTSVLAGERRQSRGCRHSSPALLEVSEDR